MSKIRHLPYSVAYLHADRTPTFLPFACSVYMFQKQSVVGKCDEFSILVSCLFEKVLPLKQTKVLGYVRDYFFPHPSRNVLQTG